MAIQHCPAAFAVSEGVGVFVGISSPDYADLAKAHSEISAYSATGKLCSYYFIGCSCTCCGLLCGRIILSSTGLGDWWHGCTSSHTACRVRPQCGCWPHLLPLRLQGAQCQRRHRLLLFPGRRPHGAAEHGTGQLRHCRHSRCTCQSLLSSALINTCMAWVVCPPAALGAGWIMQVTASGFPSFALRCSLSFER